MKQTEKQGEKNRTGAIGEEIACKWLDRKGLKIVDRNYLKKWGEIDIVAHETGIYHFIEVKTVSYETKADYQYSISHETWRPEDNVHNAKLKRLARAIQSWISEHRYTGNWQIDVVVVKIVPRERFATVKMIKNVIIG